MLAGEVAFRLEMSYRSLILINCRLSLAYLTFLSQFGLVLISHDLTTYVFDFRRRIWQIVICQGISFDCLNFEAIIDIPEKNSLT
jgi:hypothetical protein